ncbi:MAG: LysM peptidoglycan-binding domain-containing protein, partial [Kiritimatiellae bacterium]|nr:LysM peptidoglycan-binding domain-containing protein [Kiritimatiellia bacterium]
AEQPAKDEPAAAVAAAPAVPAPAAPAFKTYEVKEGENINDISAEWGLVPQEIRDLNNMDADADVKPGQIIKLPASASQE